MVTVYSLPACVQCESTKRQLKKKNVEFVEVKLHEDEAAYEMVKSLGYQSAPVVIAGEQHWSGFRPDMIDALAS